MSLTHWLTFYKIGTANIDQIQNYILSLCINRSRLKMYYIYLKKFSNKMVSKFFFITIYIFRLVIY